MTNKEFKALVSQTSVAQLSADVVREWNEMDENQFLSHLNDAGGRVYPVIYGDNLMPYSSNQDLPWD